MNNEYWKDYFDLVRLKNAGNAFADAIYSVIDEEAQRIDGAFESEMTNLKDEYNKSVNNITSKYEKSKEQIGTIKKNIRVIHDEFDNAFSAYKKHRANGEKQAETELSANGFTPDEIIDFLIQKNEEAERLLEKYYAQIHEVKSGKRLGVFTGVFNSDFKMDCEQLWKNRYMINLLSDYWLSNQNGFLEREIDNKKQEFLSRESQSIDKQNQIVDNFKNRVIPNEEEKGMGVILNEMEKIFPYAKVLGYSRFNFYSYWDIVSVNDSNCIRGSNPFLPIVTPYIECEEEIAKEAISRHLYPWTDRAGILQLPLLNDGEKVHSYYVTYYEDLEKKETPSAAVDTIMVSYMSRCPLDSLKFTVYAPLLRAKSLETFTPLLNKESPSKGMFETLYDAELLQEKLKSLNQKIDQLMTDSDYMHEEDIYEYASRHDEIPQTELLVINDFPKGFSEGMVENLLRIVRDGGKFGIDVIINEGYDIQAQYKEADYLNHRNLLIENAMHIEEDEYDNLMLKNWPISISMAERDYLNSLDYISDNCFTEDGYYEISDEFIVNLSGYLMDLAREKGLDYEKRFSLLKDFFEAYNSAIEKIRSERTSFDALIDTERKSTDYDVLRLPLGFSAEGKPIQLGISVTGKGDTQHHVLIGGSTGSGKSTLLHTMILSGMLNYNPDELNLYVMDFKQGVEFAIYDDYKLPHIPLLVLNSNQEFGESVLEYLVNEIERRAKIIRSAGKSDLVEYMEETEEGKRNPLPKILVIADEFQVMFDDNVNRIVAKHNADMAALILQQGRSFGIHLVFSTQSIKAIENDRLKNMFGQIGIRIGLGCNENDATALFGYEKVTDAMSKMQGPKGTAVVYSNMNSSENIRMQVAYCEDKEKYLKELENNYKSKYEAFRRITFDRGQSSGLLEQMRDTEWQQQVSNSKFAVIPIGKTIKLSEDGKNRYMESMSTRENHNALICGDNEKLNNNIIMEYMMGALNYPSMQVFMIDGDSISGDMEYDDYYNVLNDWSGNFRYAKSNAEVFSIIDRAYDLFADWSKNKTNESLLLILRNVQFSPLLQDILARNNIDEQFYRDDSIEDIFSNSDTEEIAGNKENPIDVFDSLGFGEELKTIASIERHDYMDSSTRSSSNRAAIPAYKKIHDIIKQGQSVGIHVIITASNYATVRDSIISSGIMNRMPKRFLFSINTDHANHLLSDAYMNMDMSTLDKDTAFFSDSISNSMQIKPFVAPTVDELKEYIEENR